MKSSHSGRISPVNCQRVILCALVVAALLLIPVAGCSTTGASLRSVPRNPLMDQLHLAAKGGPKPTERTMQLVRVNNLEIDLCPSGGDHKRTHASEIPDEAPFYLGGEGYYREDEEFISSIGTDKQPLWTWQEGYQVQKTLHAIYESERTGCAEEVGP